MFRFFRILRRKLLEEDKFRKYFWYAIGEVFLVVIGILIALQINNWNEDRKLQQMEVEYLGKLKQEFLANKETIDRKLIRFRLNESDQTRLLDLHQKDIQFEAKEMVYGIETSGFAATIELKKEIWNDLYSTGNALIFENSELQNRMSFFYKKLIGYENLVEELNDFRRYNRRVSQNVLDPGFRIEMVNTFVENPDSQDIFFENMDIDVNEVIKRYQSRSEIGANLADQIMVTRVLLRIGEELMNEVDVIVQAIDSEIERLN